MIVLAILFSEREKGETEREVNMDYESEYGQLRGVGREGEGFSRGRMGAVF